MLKAIITVLDEDNRVLQANRLIDEMNSVPVGLGIEHEFRFKIVTADEDLIRKFNKEINKECNAGFTLRADEIREAWKKHLYGEEEQNE